MKRTKNKNNPSDILTGDWHLREDTPACRTDDFWTAQWKKVEFVSALQKKYDCPVIHSGDLFNHWKPSPYLLSTALKYLPKQFYTTYGNHDLPQHNLELAYKCGINTLAEAGALQILPGCHWGDMPVGSSLLLPETSKVYQMLVWHVMTYQGKKPWPGMTDSPARSLLKKYPDYDIIVTGHNHKSFVETDGDRLLINPGSLTRQSADQINQIPKVFLWFKETNSYEEVPIPHNKEAISREHIDVIEERDGRIDAFISKLNNDWEAEMDFMGNLNKFFQANNTEKLVKEITLKAIE